MLTATGSRELRAVASAVKLARRDIVNDINKATRATVNPLWRDAVDSAARSKMDRAVLSKGARVAAGNPPKLVAATSTRALSGGFTPSVSWAAFEFGADPSKVTTYTGKSPRGKAYQIRRHTTHQLPRVNKKGRVLYSTTRDVIPRVAALWTQIVVRKFAEAFEAGGKV
jgi:hypothetical protein